VSETVYQVYQCYGVSEFPVSSGRFVVNSSGGMSAELAAERDALAYAQTLADAHAGGYTFRTKRTVTTVVCEARPRQTAPEAGAATSK
jgi:hypothetical protein